MSCHVFFACVPASVLTTVLACRGQVGCADRWLGFITASLAACVKAGDAAYRSVSNPPTFPTFTSATLSYSVSENTLASTSRSQLPCFSASVIQRVCHCLKLVCIQLSSPLIACQQACRPVPWPPCRPVFCQPSSLLPIASVAARVKNSDTPFTSVNVSPSFWAPASNFGASC